MKLQRFIAANIQKAVDKIQDVFGPEALIHSTRSVEGGVEIVASGPHDNEMGEMETIYAYDGMHQHGSESVLDKLSSKLQMIDNNLQNLSKFINTRHMYDTHFIDDEAAIKKNLLYFHLNKLGFRGKFCQKFINNYLKSKQYADHINEDNIKKLLLKHMTFNDNEFINEKNICALIGPTGIGKTTTIAKLAKRYITRNGSNSLGLITTDYSDLVGKNQLVYYSRLFNVDLEYVNDAKDLEMVLRSMRKKKLILIDTHGVSQRDSSSVMPLLELLESQGEMISSYMTLPCNVQEPILDEIARAFSTTTLSGCILTKQDESISMAPALSVSMNYKMPLTYICNGQDVNEDIEVANPEKIIHQIINECAEIKTATEEDLIKNVKRVTEFINRNDMVHLSAN